MLFDLNRDPCREVRRNTHPAVIGTRDRLTDQSGEPDLPLASFIESVWKRGQKG